ncbi:hypothetical protein BN1013_02075 [Candidatus Rubidus massiliensis]|nr:hypothetical protein BN1013_02075 [Candidatus Rubidus massiliensis]
MTIGDYFPLNSQSYIHSDSTLLLPSGTIVSSQEFFSHPLFKDTKERENVYHTMINFCQNPEFRKNYSNFLQDIRLENWYARYLSDPLALAYLSIIAFLDKKIDLDELVTLQTLTEIITEKQKNNIVSFEVVTLNEHNLEEYLTELNFPLYVETTLLPKKNRKEEEELIIERTKLLEDVKQLSPIKRTALEYSISSFDNTMHESTQSLEMLVYYDANSRIGFKKVENYQGTMSLISTELSINSFLKAAKNLITSYEEQHFLFGFSEDDSAMDKGGRMFTIPSPLFNVPYTHRCGIGPKSLQLFFHDIYYHFILELNIPHKSQFIAIANELSRLKIDNLEHEKIQKKLAIILKDREAYDYLKYDKELAFVKFLSFAIKQAFANKNKSEIKDWATTIFLPILKKHWIEDQLPSDVELLKKLKLS